MRWWGRDGVMTEGSVVAGWGEGVEVGVSGFGDDAELCRLGDDGACAIAAVELLSAVVEFDVEFVGGDSFSRGDDFAEDVA